MIWIAQYPGSGQPVLLDANALGDRADHFRWARTPAAVVNSIAEWHQQKNQ